MKNSRVKKYLSYIAILISGIALDQAVKYFSVLYLKPVSTYPLFQDVFHLTYRENTGAAFSILEGHTWFFVVLTGIVIIFITYLLVSEKVESLTASYSLMFIITGGIGNLIDRVVQGYVVDMFDFRLINFAVFNVADTFVTCGTVVFLICFIFSKGEIIKWK